MNHIVYRGKEYPVRRINIGLDTENIVNVAQHQLEEALSDECPFAVTMNDDGAIEIDDMICWYCNDEEWKLNNEQLAKYIKRIL